MRDGMWTQVWGGWRRRVGEGQGVDIPRRGTAYRNSVHMLGRGLSSESHHPLQIS